MTILGGKKTKSDVKLFSEWLHKENEDRLIEDIEKDKLDHYLARFILSAVKTGLQSNCTTSYSRSGVNQM